MRTSLIAVFVFATACWAGARPNVLLIYSDDHGWGDLGAQGVDKDIRTPALDALASSGVRCARGYVSAPQCVPSRAGVLTGRYQQRFGLEDNTCGALPLTELTLAERLKPAGYVTGQVGKWHLDLQAELPNKKGRAPLTEHMPVGQGFDECWRGELKRYLATHDLAGERFTAGPQWVDDARFRVDVQTEAALSFLRRREGEATPWFLYLAYFTPHVPLESPQPWFDQTPAHLPKERRQALAMIAAMDAGVGQVRAELKRQGQLENTLIFFIADNGAPTKQGHWDGSINKPLLGEKGMLTDGGVRVPFLVSWPGTLPGGKVYDLPVINLDVAATACALAGQPTDGLDGVNLIPFLTGERSGAPHERLFWRWRSQAAVLEHPWKLIRLGPEEQMLVNVTLPEQETQDLLGKHPEVAARLGAALADWASELQPPGLPTKDNDQDRLFFAEHIDAHFAPAAVQPKAKEAGMHGWLCRNGSMTSVAGGMALKPDAAAVADPFLTYAPLDFLGPARLTLRCRAKAGGAGSVSWRVRHQEDFVKAQRLPFVWPTSNEWTDVEVELGAKSRFIHLRLYAPKEGQGIEIQSIRLQREGQPGESWDFSK
jgi:arylsulfatase A-like enzyme